MNWLWKTKWHHVQAIKRDDNRWGEKAEKFRFCHVIMHELLLKDNSSIGSQTHTYTHMRNVCGLWCHHAKKTPRRSFFGVSLSLFVFVTILKHSLLFSSYPMANVMFFKTCPRTKDQESKRKWKLTNLSLSIILRLYYLSLHPRQCKFTLEKAFEM